MLQIENLNLNFGNEEIFCHFNLHVNKGEMVCITGQSGRGKTTLLKAIMGFIPFQAGTIIVNDTQLSPKTSEYIRKQIAWMPQELALPTEWVRDMIRLPLDLRANRNNHQTEDKLLQNLKALGLGKELLDKRTNEISGGQRQKIMLAVTALLDKKLIIIDEPTSALDQESTEKVLHFLHRQLTPEKSILIVSHNRLLAEGCTRIVTL